MGQYTVPAIIPGSTSVPGRPSAHTSASRLDLTQGV